MDKCFKFCHFVTDDQILTQCKYKSKYGDYCYKHRRLHLVENDVIKHDTFTGLSKDYLKKDMSYLLLEVIEY